MTQRLSIFKLALLILISLGIASSQGITQHEVMADNSTTVKESVTGIPHSSVNIAPDAIIAENIAGAWNNKGVALHNQGRYDEAIKAYDEAIRLDPEYANAWNNKGSADQGRYDEAIKDMTRQG